MMNKVYLQNKSDMQKINVKINHDDYKDKDYLDKIKIV